MQLDNSDKAEKLLARLDKKDLIHLLVWGMPQGALTKAVNNKRCRECQAIKSKMQ